MNTVNMYTCIVFDPKSLLNKPKFSYYERPKAAALQEPTAWGTQESALGD